MRASLAVLALALVSGACTTGDDERMAMAAQPVAVAPWTPVDAETGKIRDETGLEALTEAFPDSSSVRLRLLNAQLQEGKGAATLGTLQWLNERGYVFSEVAQGQIPMLIGEEFSDQAMALLVDAPKAIENSEVVWTVPWEAGLVEGIVVDTEPRRMVATSVSGRSIWGTTPRGSWKLVSPENADNLSGLADEGPGSVLWVTSGNVDQSDDTTSYFSGLIGLRGELSELRFAAPEGVTLSDIHVAADRTLYASDPLNGGVYTLGPDRELLEILIAPGKMRSPQGLVTSADGQKLYVSDYRYGIAIVDLETRKLSRLTADVPVILDGTDGLFRRGNSLIAIQNGTSPMRISQLTLSPDGNRVVAVRILEQAHSKWTEPLGGHLGENALYYVGNGQWDKYVAGVLGKEKEPDPTQIMRLPLTDQ